MINSTFFSRYLEKFVKRYKVPQADKMSPETKTREYLHLSEQDFKPLTLMIVPESLTKPDLTECGAPVVAGDR